jgi:hypothetical protein
LVRRDIGKWSFLDSLYDKEEREQYHLKAVGEYTRTNVKKDLVDKTHGYSGSCFRANETTPAST